MASEGAAVLRTHYVIEAIRKEVRRLSGISLEPEYLVALVENEIVKRELLDSDEGDATAAYVKRLQRAAKRDLAESANAAKSAPTAGAPN
jgi:hypothetical protein